MTRLAADALRWTCDPASLPVDSTDDCPPCDEIVGQPRAVEAVRLALGIDAPGYNVFLAGLEGSGRTTTIDRYLERRAAGRPVPPDLLYVHRFADPARPRLLTLAAGGGREFGQAMTDLVEDLAQTIPRLLESDEFDRQAREVAMRHGEAEQERWRTFEEMAAAEGFQLRKVQMGAGFQPGLVPIVDGQPVGVSDLQQAVADGTFEAAELARIEARGRDLAAQVTELFKESRKAQRQLREALERVQAELVGPSIEGAVGEIRAAFAGEEVGRYLDDVAAFLLREVDRFLALLPDDDAERVGLARPSPHDLFGELAVNLLVDNAESTGAPIVREFHPSAENLFGSIDVEFGAEGSLDVDFTDIRAGSLLRATGGYLIVSAIDLLAEPSSYTTLKRTLRHRKLEVHAPRRGPGGLPLHPDPIDLSVKVFLIGPREIHSLLHAHDPDFREVFKVVAEFDWELDRTEDNIAGYLSILRKICAENGLMAFDRRAIAALLERAARMAGRQDRLTASLRRIADLAREADFDARQDGATTIGAEHVARALAAASRRRDLVETKIRRSIEEGQVRVETDGVAVGQVNGLAVYQLEDHAFGKPSRITAEASMGTRGVVNIERESRLSGRTHDKGVLILTGFLAGRFATDRPLAIDVRVCFEQSYGGVDGDSASSAEVYAILSAISGIPLRQDLAVTGSVDQKGRVQAIGGVNEKIEGFFDVCRARGLTGRQGVLVPAANVRDLMLRRDVVEAVRAEEFHVHALTSIEEGVELLTGRPAGRRGKRGAYPKGSVFRIVDKALERAATALRDYLQRPELP